MSSQQIAICLAFGVFCGCEQLLGADQYITGSGGGASSTTSSVGGAGGLGVGGAGGEGGDPLAAAPACYHDEDALHLERGFEIVGHQARCSVEQLDELAACWPVSQDCPEFFGNFAANKECIDCIVGDEQKIVPVLFSFPGALQKYVQVEACEAVAQGKAHCIEIVGLAACRVTACEACYPTSEAGQLEYDECLDFAGTAGCSDIVLPLECTSLQSPLTDQCAAPTVVERAVNTATVLCGP